MTDENANRPGSRFRVNPDTVANRIGNQVILVHLQTDRIFELNRTAARLWELISDGCDLPEIQSRLLQEFDVTESQLAGEIQALLASLEKEQFLEIDHES